MMTSKVKKIPPPVMRIREKVAEEAEV